MNGLVIKQGNSTFLQKAREVSNQTKDNDYLGCCQNNTRVTAILTAHPREECCDYSTYYDEAFSVSQAMELAQPDVELGSFSFFAPEDNPTLIDYKNAYGLRTLVSWMFSHVSAMNAASSASNRMDRSDIVLCCQDIVSTFPWLTLAEFSVFCVRMRTLKYASKRSDYIFGSDVIFRGLREFCRDRAESISRYERSCRAPVERADAISWEEYCKRTGKAVSDNPIAQLQEKLANSNQ